MVMIPLLKTWDNQAQSNWMRFEKTKQNKKQGVYNISGESKVCSTFYQSSDFRPGRRISKITVHDLMC